MQRIPNPPGALTGQSVRACHHLSMWKYRVQNVLWDTCAHTYIIHTTNRDQEGKLLLRSVWGPDLLE